MMLDHAREVLERYKGKNRNYKVFNEPVHGEQYRKNLPNIWQDVFDLMKEVDPDAERIINDYQLISGDTSQCFNDLVEGYTDIDYIGVQAHVKGFFNAEVTQERYDLLSETGIPLWITEFDVQNWNRTDRGLDVADHIRLAYGNPKIKGFTLWSVIFGTSGQNFYDRLFLEGVLNEHSEPYVDLGYPGYPNAAGVAYIELVKGEFMSNFTKIVNNGERVQRRLTPGDYMVTLTGPDGEVLSQEVQTINSVCDPYALEQLVVDGEFDSGFIDTQITINGIGKIHWDGYVTDALAITGHSGDNVISIDVNVPSHSQYVLQFYVKLTQLTEAVDIVITADGAELF